MLLRSKTLARELLDANPLLREELTGISPPPARPKRTFSTEGGETFHVVEGDLALDDDELFLYLLRAETPADPAPDAILGGQTALVGITHEGRAVRWDSGVVLSYCVLESSFVSPDDYQAIVSAVAKAARGWEEICNVRFEHRPQFDNAHPAMTATDIDSNLIFTVRLLDTEGKFIASAFLPTQPPTRRKLYIDPSYFSSHSDYDPVGVLRHELGHVLGFRHENARADAPSECPDEEIASLVPLTKYDPESVMHYFCGASGTKKLSFTELDRQGASFLYGAPPQ